MRYHESDEGLPATSSEYDAFKGLLGRILAVPRSEIVKREAAYQ